VAGNSDRPQANRLQKAERRDASDEQGGLREFGSVQAVGWAVER
jgi:hypothetical protein